LDNRHKKKGNNRYPWGKSIIQIEETAIEEYESATGIKIANNKNYKIITVRPNDKHRFKQLLNERQ